MSDPNYTPDQFRIPRDGLWWGLWKVMAAIAIVGIAVAAVGYVGDSRRFAFSYLFAFMATLTIAIGALFFVLIQHLTAAGWSVVVRRLSEILASGLPLFIILVVPVLLSIHDLYPWTHIVPEKKGSCCSGHTKAHHSEHIGSHYAADKNGAAPSTQAPSHIFHKADGFNAHDRDHTGAAPTQPTVKHTAEHALHEEILSRKAGYLNPRFFYARSGIYVLIWAFLSIWFFKRSVQQDESHDKTLTRAMQRFAPPATFLLALSLTFAAFDWVMSLEPGWYSTIYGVYFFAQSIVAIFALLTVLALALHASGVLKAAVNVNHFHDLGKLLFGFLVFWTYIAFSQFLLIWYASIPEETTYYHARWNAEGWRVISLFIVFGKFVVPFLFLLSRNVKRRLSLLGLGASWLLAMHIVDVYWFVLPYYKLNSFEPHMLDLACFMAVAGTYFAFVLFRMRRYSLVPVGDPRLQRSLEFQNA